jgi:hypothetical protein
MKTIICKQTINAMGITICLALSLNTLPAQAFPDIYEPNNTPEEAIAVVIGDETPKQHTLHQTEDGDKDEDWFKFYAMKNVEYDVKVISVGSDIDVVVELYDAPDAEIPIGGSNDGAIGRDEIYTVPKLKEGTYYLKVRDNAESMACRTNIQYELLVLRRPAVYVAELKGSVTDTISGKPIKYAVVFTTCKTSDTSFSGKNGGYSIILTCEDGEAFKLTAEVDGYKQLTCNLIGQEILPIYKNLPLLPNGKNLPAPTPSQSVYNNGDKLRVTLPSLFEGCVDYYVAMRYPQEAGSGLFIITKPAKKLNDLTAFTGSPLQWNGSGNVAIDMPIEDMPLGIYTLYLLRTPEGVANPLADKHLENVSTSTFEVKK